MEVETDVSLPHCKVCQDPSSGIHYGVPTCNACKGFFGRSLRGQIENKVCTKNNRCNLRGANKNSCAPCRFHRCREAGMSKHAIKTGRYSLQKRHLLKLEVQSSRSCLYHRIPDSDCSRSSASDESKAGSPNTETEETPSSTTYDDETLDEIIGAIIDAYQSVPSNLYRSQEEIDHITATFKEEQHLKEKLFGKMPFLPKDDFVDVFESTGMDVDGRLQFIQRYLHAFRCWINKVVRFAKSIPGFTQLTLTDQFNLIQYNRREFWFLTAFKGFNRDLGTCVMPNGTIAYENEYYKAFFTDSDKIMLDLSENMKRLRLLPEEQVIVQAIALTVPDRIPLQHRAAVEQLQTTLITCLQHLIKQRSTSRRDQIRALGHATDMLSAVRTIGAPTSARLSEERFTLEFHDLKNEIYGSSHAGCS